MGSLNFLVGGKLNRPLIGNQDINSLILLRLFDEILNCLIVKETETSYLRHVFIQQIVELAYR